MPRWIIKSKIKGEYPFPIQDEGLIEMPFGCEGLVTSGQKSFPVEGFLRLENNLIEYHYILVFDISFYLN